MCPSFSPKRYELVIHHAELAPTDRDLSLEASQSTTCVVSDMLPAHFYFRAAAARASVAMSISARWAISSLIAYARIA